MHEIQLLTVEMHCAAIRKVCSTKGKQNCEIPTLVQKKKKNPRTRPIMACGILNPLKLSRPNLVPFGHLENLDAAPSL